MNKKVLEQIQKRAYELYLERGGIHGSAMEDWLAAEKEIAGSPKSRTAPRKKREPAMVR